MINYNVFNSYSFTVSTFAGVVIFASILATFSISHHIFTHNCDDYNIAYVCMFTATIIVAVIWSVIFYVDTTYYYPSQISHIIEYKKDNVSLLPNEIMTNDTYCFIINGKELKTKKYEGTKYVQDSKNRPYIIYEKVTYKAPNNFFISAADINKIKDTTVYFLKEIHY